MKIRYLHAFLFFFFYFSLVLKSQNEKETIEGISKQHSIDIKEAEGYYNFRKNLVIKPDENSKTENSLSNCSPSASNNNQNIGFESGNFSNWNIKRGTFINSLNDSTVNTISDTITTSSILTTGVDFFTGFSYNSPFAGNHVIKLNDGIANTEATFMTTRFVVTPSNNILKTAFSFVSSNAGHSCDGNSYLRIQLFTCSGTNLIKEYLFIPDYGNCNGYNPGFFNPMAVNFQAGHYFATDWKKLCFDLRNYVGEEVKLKIFVSDCNLTVHYGYTYFDAEFGYLPLNAPLINNFTVNSAAYSYSTGVLSQCFNQGSILQAQTTASVTYPISLTSFTTVSGSPISLSQEGVYNFIQSPIPGCSIVDNIDFNVKPTVSLTIPSSTFCPNSVFTCTLSGAKTYTVKLDGSPYAVFSTTNAPVSFGLFFLPAGGHTITAVGGGGINCVDSTSAVVQVFPQALLTVSYNPSVCNGTTMVSVSGAATYTWNNSSNTPTNIVNVLGVTSVSVTGTDNIGCYATPSSFTIQGVPITITLTTANPICVGDSGYCYISGASNYTWSNGYTGCCQYLKPTLSNPNFSVITTNSCNTTVTYTVPFNVLPSPTNFTVNYSSVPVCPGTTFTIQGVGANFYFKWGPTGAYSNSVNAYVTNANPTFTAIALGANGCNTGTVITVPTLPSPTLSLSGNSICVGPTSTTLTAFGASTYTWGSVLQSPTISVSTNTSNFNVTLDGTNLSGCTSYSTFPVIIENPSGIIFSGNSTTVCAGANSVTLSAMPFAAGGTYSWSTGATTQNIVITPTATTTYSVFTNSNLCGPNIYTITISYNSNPITPLTYTLSPVCPGKNYTLTVNGASTYQYNNGTSTPVNTISGASPGFIFPIFMSVTGAQSTGCVSTITLQIATSPTPACFISYPMGTYGCKNTTMNIAAAGLQTYTWSTSATGGIVAITPSVNISYTVIGTAATGCTASAVSNTIYGVNPPTITITPPTPSVCPNSAFTLSASVVGGSGFVWSNSVSAAVITTSINVPTVFSVTSSTPSCTSTKTVLVNLYDPVTFSITSPICTGATNILSYNATPPGGTLFVNGVPTNSIFSNSTNTFNISYSVQDTGSCVLTTNTLITINQTPCVKIVANTYTSCIGAQVTFSGTPAGGYFSGLNVSGNTLSLTAAGNYTVLYTYTDLNNCSNSICTEVNSSLCTDIKNINLNLINLYPNPAKNTIIIDNPLGGKILLKVYDLNGRLLYNSGLESTSSIINISDYTNGLYIFYLESDSDRRYIKIIKD